MAVAALRDTFRAPEATDPDVDVEGAFERLTGNVLILGGYRGSVLRDAVEGHRLWVPLRVGLNLRGANLTIGLSDEDERRAPETVRADKALTSVAGLDLGKTLKSKLRALDEAGQIRFVSWGYDWRLSLDLSSARLVETLEDIKRSTGFGTTLLCHSMGGLVALHALGRAADPTIFKRLVCCGTPFRGVPNILGPLRRGDPVLRNRSICSPSAVFSMRSSFYLLYPNMPLFELHDGTPVPIDWHSVESWSKHALSPVAAGILHRDGDEVGRIEARASAAEASGDDGDLNLLPIAPTLSRTESSLVPPDPLPASQSSSRLASALRPLRERLGGGLPASVNKLTPVTLARAADAPSDTEIIDYLTRTLERSSRFWSELSEQYDPTKADRYPPIVLIASNKTATVRGALVDSPDGVRDVDFSRLLYAEGDGIVLHTSSTNMPSPWQPRAIIPSGHGHVTMLSDLSAVARALEA